MSLRQNRNKTIKRYRNIAKNIRFTNATDKDRTFWVEMVYPFGAEFLKILQEIPWKDYSFEGTTDILLHVENNESETFVMNVGLGIEEEYIKTKVKGSAVLSKVPYTIFGGSACELYNRKYKTNVVLEPTADIDCRLALPNFTSSEISDDIYINIYDSTYTPLIKDYTHWLFDQLCKCLEKYTTIVEEFPFKKAEKEENEETENADLFHNVGNFLVTRVYQPDNLGVPTIKLQISVTAGNVTFHVLEFLLTGQNTNITSEIIEGYHVIPLQKLFFSQIKALENRKETTKYCKRIKMLSTVMNKKKIKGISKKLLDTIQCGQNVKNVTNLLG